MGSLHNHNQEVVYTMSKIQNETKSQHICSVSLVAKVVYTMSKIQNETKSQHATLDFQVGGCCLYYVKDTK